MEEYKENLKLSKQKKAYYQKKLENLDTSRPDFFIQHGECLRNLSIWAHRVETYEMMLGVRSNPVMSRRRR